MKRGYCKVLYNQRNKDETIISVIKRLFEEHITSRLVRTQNRELSFRCIAYNTHRLTNLTLITWFLQSLSIYLFINIYYIFSIVFTFLCHTVHFKYSLINTRTKIAATINIVYIKWLL